LAAEVVDANARRQSTKPWGQTLWFYRGDGCEESNRPPGSPCLPCSATTSRRGICARNLYPFPPKMCQTFRLPGRTRTLYLQKRYGSKNCSSDPPRPRSLTAGPSTVSTAVPRHPYDKRTDSQAAKTQAHELHRSLAPRSSLSRANPRWIPMNGIPGSQLSYPAKQPPNLTTIPAKGPTSAKKKSPSSGQAVGNNRGPRLSESSISKKPPKEYSTPPWAWGLHPLGVLARTRWQIGKTCEGVFYSFAGSGLQPPGALARTPWQVKKSPRRFYLNRPRARGLLSGTNTRVPEEKTLMVIIR